MDPLMSHSITGIIYVYNLHGPLRVRLALTSAPMKSCDVCLYESSSSEFCNLMSHELSMQFYQLDVSELMQLDSLVI
jgi:hypothetical protein